ncbi:MAG: YlxR family protein [Myxococcota bacterium]|nr:YlxR family protein [Myxococcota bacterium]
MHAESRPSTRTCVGCRRPAGRGTLLRLAPAPGAGVARPLVDVRRCIEGRGASVHPRRACIVAAVTRGGLARAWRRPVDANVDEVMRAARDGYVRRATALVRGGARAGRVVVGEHEVRRVLREAPSRVALLVVATEAEARQSARERLAARGEERLVACADRETLGEITGQADVTVLAVLDVAVAGRLRVALEALDALTEEA